MGRDDMWVAQTQASIYIHIKAQNNTLSRRVCRCAARLSCVDSPLLGAQLMSQSNLTSYKYLYKYKLDEPSPYGPGIT